MTFGEIAVTLQGGGAAGHAGRAGKDSASWVAVRPGSGSYWLLVGTQCWVAMRPEWLVGPDGRGRSVAEGSQIPKS